MKKEITIYQVSFNDLDDDEHKGYSYFSSRSFAEKSLRDNTRSEINSISFKINTSFSAKTINDIISEVVILLNKVASHPDNG